MPPRRSCAMPPVRPRRCGPSATAWRTRWRAPRRASAYGSPAICTTTPCRRSARSHWTSPGRWNHCRDHAREALAVRRPHRCSDTKTRLRQMMYELLPPSARRQPARGGRRVLPQPVRRRGDQLRDLGRSAEPADTDRGRRLPIDPGGAAQRGAGIPRAARCGSTCTASEICSSGASATTGSASEMACRPAPGTPAWRSCASEPRPWAGSRCSGPGSTRAGPRWSCACRWNRCNWSGQMSTDATAPRRSRSSPPTTIRCGAPH